MSPSNRPPRYTHEELVTISKSPLCEPPDFELPCQEWIGAEYLANRSKKSSKLHDMDHVKTEFDNNHEKISYPKSPTARSSKLKQGADKSATFKDSIVLGPPKMSFASSSSQSVRNRDLDAENLENRKNSNNNGLSSSYRSGTRAGNQASSTAPRESSKDGEGWVSVPPKGARKSSFASSEEEGKHRDLFRARERLGSNARRSEGRETAEKFETGHDNATREWRRGKIAIPEVKSSSKIGNRALKGKNNGFRAIDEQDPEWLNEDSFDSIEDPLATGSAGPGHTVQDFEAWKAQMRAQRESPKASTTTAIIVDTDEVQDTEIFEQESISMSIEETSTTRSSFPSKKVDVDRLFLAGPSTSSFTSKLAHSNEDRLAEARMATVSPGVAAPPAQPMPAGRASRFSTFFRSDSAQTNPHSNTSQISGGDSRPESVSPGLKGSGIDSKASKEDKEGFNRIMVMLGKNNSGPNTVSSSAAATVGSSRASPASPPQNKSAETQFFQSLQDKGVMKTPQSERQSNAEESSSVSKVDKDKNFLFSLMGKGGAKPEVSPEKPSGPVLSPNVYGGPPGLGLPLGGVYNERNMQRAQQPLPVPLDFQNMPPPSFDGVPQWINPNEAPYMGVGSPLRGGPPPPPPPGIFMPSPYGGRPNDMTYPQGNAGPLGFGPSQIPPGLAPPSEIQSGAPKTGPSGFYSYGNGLGPSGPMPPPTGPGQYPYGAPPPHASTAANNYGGRQ